MTALMLAIAAIVAIITLGMLSIGDTSMATLGTIEFVVCLSLGMLFFHHLSKIS